MFVLLVGFPASGKSTLAAGYAAQGHAVFSRDVMPKKNASYDDVLDACKAFATKQPTTPIVVDNTFLLKAQRAPFIELARSLGRPVTIHHVATGIDTCFVNAMRRQFHQTGNIAMTGKPSSSVHVFPPAVLYKARKDFELPEAGEADAIKVTKGIKPAYDPARYPNKAVFFDVDGTLRNTEHLPNKYPTSPDEVELLADGAKMTAKLRALLADGYLLFGVSNQSGVAKGVLTEDEVAACMDRTRDLLGLSARELPIFWCPHRAAPLSCYCRKPNVGFAVLVAETYGVDPAKSLMVGDRTTDKTFAARMGMAYQDAKAFWQKS